MDINYYLEILKKKNIKCIYDPLFNSYQIIGEDTKTHQNLNGGVELIEYVIDNYFEREEALEVLEFKNIKYWVDGGYGAYIILSDTETKDFNQAFDMLNSDMELINHVKEYYL